MPKGIRMRAPFATTIRKMEPSLATLLILTVGAVAVVGLLLAVTAPTGLLVGDTQWHYISAFHGLGATMFLLGATIAVYLSWRLFIVSAFTLWRYGKAIVRHPEARAAASIPVLLGWVFLLIAYVLGAAITKLR